MTALSPDLEVLGEAGDGQQALEKVQALRPNVVLMDVRMSGMDGVEATRRIRTEFPATEVIILSNYDEDRFVFEALRAGAKSYLLKDVSPDRLAEAIRSVARGESALDSGVMSRLVSEFQSLSQRGQSGPERLTARELEILQCLVDGRSNQEIANLLVVSEKTVKSHLTSVYRKLDVRDRSQAIVAGLREGLVNVPSAERD